jgi:hypothetical protein
VLFLSGGADSVGVDRTVAEPLQIAARVNPIVIVNASKTAIRATLPARVEFCKPLAFFISSDL